MIASGQARSGTRGRQTVAKLAALVIALFAACGVLRAQSQAQLAPSDILGEIVGNDISVIGASLAVPVGNQQAIAFSSGGTIVVHSGKARLQFTGGGQLDICGPAKFTVLASGEALTIALSFGRVHLRFDAARPITIYTPLTLATPLSISQQPRDATVGLTGTGAMCVLAAHGAVRLQNQLSGESMVVPQPSEVLLTGSSFGNSPATAGQCRCDFDEPTATDALPQQLFSVPRAQEARPIGPDSRRSQTSSASNRAPIASRTGIQSRADSTAAVPAPPPRAPEALAKPNLQITLPPIGYNAKSATPPAEPLSVATLMLAKETLVQPQWVFEGLVIAQDKRAKTPSSNSVLQHGRAGQSKRETQDSGRQSFWSKLHNLFFGRRADCQGVGCS